MNWKQLLKPTKKKIIITSILLIVTEYFAFMGGYNSLQCEPCAPYPAYCPPCVSMESGIFSVLITLIPAGIIIYFISVGLTALLAIFREK